MKRVLPLLVVLLLLLSACGANNAGDAGNDRDMGNDTQSQSTTDSAEGSVDESDDTTEDAEQGNDEEPAQTIEESPEVDEASAKPAIDSNKGSGKYAEITLPADFFYDEPADQVIALAKEQGLDDVIPNEDGSYTYIIERNKHKAMLKQMKDEQDQEIKNFLEGENPGSFKEITINDDFTELIAVVDEEEYWKNADAFALVSTTFTAVYYQLFNEVDYEDIAFETILVNHNTGEVFDRSGLEESDSDSDSDSDWDDFFDSFSE